MLSSLIAGYWLRIQQNNDDKVFDLYFIEPIEKDDIPELSDDDFENLWNNQMNNSFSEFNDIENDSQQSVDNLFDSDVNCHYLVSNWNIQLYQSHSNSHLIEAHYPCIHS